MEEKIIYELLVVCVNEGFSEDVMEAAKSKGARGGTSFKTRGFGNQETEEKFQMVISPNREMILIIVEKSLKEPIMNAIYEKCGIETPAMGIIFTTHIDNIAGIPQFKKDNNE